MPKKFGTVIVSGGNFLSKQGYSCSGYKTKKAHKSAPKKKQPKTLFLVAPEKFILEDFIPIEINKNRIIAFLVRLKNTPEILFFTKMNLLRKFVFTHSYKDDSIRKKYLELEKLYGLNYRADWVDMPEGNGAYFDDVSFKLGGIIKKEYALKKGDDYQAYFRKTFWFCNFDDKLIEAMVQSYFFKLKDWCQYKNMLNKANGNLPDSAHPGNKQKQKSGLNSGAENGWTGNR